MCIKNALFQSHANITNYDGTHRCGDYCLRGVRMSYRFDHIKHSNLPEDTKFMGADNVQMVNLIEKECRMRFFKPLLFDNSGEYNSTRCASM